MSRRRPLASIGQPSARGSFIPLALLTLAACTQAVPAAQSGDRLGADEWRTFAIPELGITFEFRPGEGTLEYSLWDRPDHSEPCADGRPDGALASWLIKYQSASTRRLSTTFAWAPSAGFGPDSGESGFAILGWTDAADLALNFCGKEISVSDPRVVELDDGASALLYTGDPGDPDPAARDVELATVNFPDGYDDRFSALTFSFWPPASFSAAEQERVVRSVRFQREGLG